MRPTPIDGELLEALPFDAVRQTFGPPDGDPTGPIRAVDVLVYVSDLGNGQLTKTIATIWQLEDGDLEKLAGGAYVIAAFHGGYLQPHALEVLDV